MRLDQRKTAEARNKEEDRTVGSALVNQRHSEHRTSSQASHIYCIRVLGVEQRIDVVMMNTRAVKHGP